MTMQNDQTYLTQAPIQKTNPLRAYVNELSSKINYAKWKQNLVLSYNYNPLATIKQKLQLDKVNYSKKMELQQLKQRRIIQNQQFTTIMTQLKVFQAKLLQNAQKMQNNIKDEKANIQKLQAIVKVKRQSLKICLKKNRQSLREQLIEQGVKTFRDIKSLARSRSTLSKTGINTARQSITNTIDNKQTYRSKQKVDQDNSKKSKQLFFSCLKSLSNLKQQYQTQIKKSQMKPADTQNERNTKKLIFKNKKKSQIINYQSVPAQTSKSKIIAINTNQQACKQQQINLPISISADVKASGTMNWENFNKLSLIQLGKLINDRNIGQAQLGRLFQ